MMDSEEAQKSRVRQFYDEIGWQQVSEGIYQNARYEDLRPVVREYIHRCHLRVNRFLPVGGMYLLDAGSGPIQYPEYLTYSDNFKYRVCVDISITALIEARQRIGEHGLFVVADISRLPFTSKTFDGVVSLHAIHHLPCADQLVAFGELYRMLKPGSTAAVVNGWAKPPLMMKLNWMVIFSQTITKWVKRFNRIILGRKPITEKPTTKDQRSAATGTFVVHWETEALIEQLRRLTIPMELHSWRSLNVRFTRAVMHDWLGGRLWLRLVFWLEERFPRYFGENGQYPLIVMKKNERGDPPLLSSQKEQQ